MRSRTTSGERNPETTRAAYAPVVASVAAALLALGSCAAIGSLAVIGLLAPPALADELVVNGDFEQPLTTGWQQELEGGTVLWGTGYDPDPDYEVYLYRSNGTGYARLLQTVELLGLDTRFSVHALFTATASLETWAAGGVSLAYLDAGGAALGETRIFTRTVYCPWENTPTLHLIEVDPYVWRDHELWIDDELPNLPGVVPSQVRAVRVSLFAETYYC